MATCRASYLLITVIVHVSVFPDTFALIVVVPAFFPTTSPEEDTVATADAEEVHFTVLFVPLTESFFFIPIGTMVLVTLSLTAAGFDVDVLLPVVAVFAGLQVE